MLLHLLRRFIKAVFNPLVDDTEIAIDEVRHQIGKIFIPGIPIEHQQLTGTHNDHDQPIVMEQGKQPSIFIDETSESKALVFLHIFLVQISIAAPFVIDF